MYFVDDVSLTSKQNPPLTELQQAPFPILKFDLGEWKLD